MTEDVVLDWERRQRTGLEEAILCAGKSAGQIAEILEAAEARERSLLLTRLAPESFAALSSHHQEVLDFDPMSGDRLFRRIAGVADAESVAVVTAGTSDLPVAGEAARTLRYYGFAASPVADIGIAGLHRLMDRLDDLRRRRVIIVAAGMDGALPSVLAGLVPGAVIAVPTSTGYGAARGGETALSSMLTSCAPGLVVVNIDNGFGAACAALRVLHAAR